MNISFALGFSGGLAFVWFGLAALIFGGAGAGAGLASLAAGFGVWTTLALATELAGGRTRGGLR